MCLGTEPVSRISTGIGTHPDKGDWESLRSARFENYAPAGGSPHQGPFYGKHGPSPSTLRLGLKDPQLSFLTSPLPGPDGPDPLVQAVQR